ncbi:hypothetical protein Btru_033851 [Bulinus truncatus]|nr:hypothetical protein Btru_033851 [Bulinus truncatus]
MLTNEQTEHEKKLNGVIKKLTNQEERIKVLMMNQESDEKKLQTVVKEMISDIVMMLKGDVDIVKSNLDSLKFSVSLNLRYFTDKNDEKIISKGQSWIDDSESTQTFKQMSHYLSDGLSRCIHTCLNIANGDEDKSQKNSQRNKSDLLCEKSSYTPDENFNRDMKSNDAKNKLDEVDTLITKHSAELRDLKQKLKRQEKQNEIILSQLTEKDKNTAAQFEEIMKELHAASDFMSDLHSKTEKLTDKNNDLEKIFDSITQKLKDHEQQMKGMSENQESDVEKIQKVKEEIDKNINDFAVTVKPLKKDVETLSADLVSFKTSNDQVLEVNRKKNEAFQRQLMKVSSKFDLLLNNITDLKNTKSIRRRVSFTVGLSKEISVPSGSIVKYDKVITNIGDCYDVATGKFTCPMDGIYLFYVSVIPKKNSTAFVKLFKNTNSTIAVFSTCEEYYGHSSNMAIIPLKQKDEVFLECSLYNDFYGAAAVLYNTFTGLLWSTD